MTKANRFDVLASIDSENSKESNNCSGERSRGNVSETMNRPNRFRVLDNLESTEDQMHQVNPSLGERDMKYKFFGEGRAATGSESGTLPLRKPVEAKSQPGSVEEVNHVLVQKSSPQGSGDASEAYASVASEGGAATGHMGGVLSHAHQMLDENPHSGFAGKAEIVRSALPVAMPTLSETHNADYVPSNGTGCKIMEQDGRFGSKTEGKAFQRPQTTKAQRQGTSTGENIEGALKVVDIMTKQVSDLPKVVNKFAEASKQYLEAGSSDDPNAQ
ncbi:hypothetical protein U1Q18_009882, partial [Sarracenia purpurea var. burkii]